MEQPSGGIGVRGNQLSIPVDLAFEDGLDSVVGHYRADCLSLCNDPLYHGHPLLDYLNASRQIVEPLFNPISLCCVRGVERANCVGMASDLAFQTAPTQDSDLEGSLSILARRVGELKGQPLQFPIVRCGGHDDVFRERRRKRQGSFELGLDLIFGETLALAFQFALDTNQILWSVFTYACEINPILLLSSAAMELNRFVPKYAPPQDLIAALERLLVTGLGNL